MNLEFASRCRPDNADFIKLNFIMASFTDFYGIDVSKDTLDIFRLTSSGQNGRKNRIDNSSASIEEWIGTLSKAASFCVLEATGTYSSRLVYLLDKHRIQFAVADPSKSKSFMEALGVSNKTDERAAHCLALMGKTLDLRPYKMPSMERQKRKQLQTAHNAMLKQRRMLKNQLHALEQLPFVERTARSAYEQILEAVEGQIGQIGEQLASLEEDEEYRAVKAIVRSVVGIGETTAHAMMLAADCFRDFPTVGELAKYFGLTPNSHYSGTSVRKRGRISKVGAPYVRSLLYMCTRSAIRYNNACRALYQRLRQKGKPHKVAAVAVMHKLVKQVFACVKSKAQFDNDYYLKYQTT